MSGSFKADTRTRKSMRKQHGISVLQMNEAIKTIFDMHSSRLVPARERLLPADVQVEVDMHLYGRCDCTDEQRCREQTVGDIKRAAWSEMPLLYEPVFDSSAVKLYCDYVNRNLTMNLDLKARLESIEERAIDFLLRTPLRPDNVKPIRGDEQPVATEEDGWEWEPCPLAEEDASKNSQTQTKGRTASGQQRPLVVFDRKPIVTKEDREEEAPANRWVQEFLADRRRSGKPSFKEVEADLDKLFPGGNTPKEGPKAA
jgi:hypothetical protein